MITMEINHWISSLNEILLNFFSNFESIEMRQLSALYIFDGMCSFLWVFRQRYEKSKTE